MTDEKAQLQRVKELINQQKYDQARDILESLPANPTAQKWLQQLNERYPKANPAEDQRLAEAQRFIDAHRYDEAMAILVTMPNNPVAQKWLERIKNLDREESPSGGTPMSDHIPPNDSQDSQPSASGSPMDYTVPMLPPIVAMVRGSLFNSLGKLGGVMTVSALMFAIYFAVIYGVDADSEIVTTVLDTVFIGLAYYGLVFGLSLAFPRIPRNVLLFTVGWVVLVTLVSGLIDSNSYLIRWVFWLLFSVGIAYLFSTYNRFVPTGGETRLSRNQFILFAILLTGLIFMQANIVYVFSSTLDLPALISGLLGGLIYGAVVGAAFALTLEEAGN